MYSAAKKKAHTNTKPRSFTKRKPMKVLKIKNHNGKRIKRSVLRVCAFYRANSLVTEPSFFDHKKLQDFLRYEATGCLPDGIINFTSFSKSNGYANGKWVAKLNQEMMEKDIDDLLISKHEICTTGKYKWWYAKVFNYESMESFYERRFGVRMPQSQDIPA